MCVTRDREGEKNKKEGTDPSEQTCLCARVCMRYKGGKTGKKKARYDKEMAEIRPYIGEGERKSASG